MFQRWKWLCFTGLAFHLGTWQYLSITARFTYFDQITIPGVWIGGYSVISANGIFLADQKHLLHRQCIRFRERISQTENAKTKKLKRWCESVGAPPKKMLSSSSTTPAAAVQCQIWSIDCRQRQRNCGSVITRDTIKRVRVKRTMGWGMQSDWWRWWVKRQMWGCNTHKR
jgi:hypothetical protein